MSFILVLVGVNLFILLAPFLLIAAAVWGTADDQEFMRIAFWVAFQFTVWLWCIILCGARRRWHGKA
jgi:hypothetical protein